MRPMLPGTLECDTVDNYLLQFSCNICWFTRGAFFGPLLCWQCL